MFRFLSKFYHSSLSRILPSPSPANPSLSTTNPSIPTTTQLLPATRQSPQMTSIPLAMRVDAFPTGRLGHNTATDQDDEDQDDVDEEDECTFVPARDQTADGSASTWTPTGPCYFVDCLPPELRLSIYEELLQPDESQSDKKLCPEILATCKFIHQEAQPIFPMWASIRLSSEKQPTMRRGLKGPYRIISQPQRLQRELANFKAPLRTFRSAVIELTLHFRQCHFTSQARYIPWMRLFEDYKTAVRFQIYKLVSEIHATNIKDVHFKIHLRGTTALAKVGPEIEQICFPLLQLGPDVKLHVTGNDEIKTTILDRAAEAYDVIGKTAMWKWVQVQQEAKTFVKLMEKAGTADANGVKYLFASLCGNLPQPAGDFRWDGRDWQAYSDREMDLSDAAVVASAKMRKGKWRLLREEAEKRLAMQEA